jgi:hypothetical protein
MAPKKVISTSNRSQRKADRQQLGALADLIVNPSTKRRYDSAAQSFFHWMTLEGKTLPPTVEAFDEVLCAYIEFLWQDGEGRSLASNTVAGLQFVRPTLRRKLPCAWRLLAAWAKRELPARAPPLTVFLLQALVGLALNKKLPNVAAALMIGFYGLLRTGEILKLTSQDFSIGKSPRTLVVNLGLTKGGARQGALESVTIHEEHVINLVQAFQFTANKGDKLLLNGGGDFRKVFSSLLEELDISE